jgi:uncharacterized phage-associated protein
MTISTFDAAKTLGHFSDWSLSNLQMQKILYIAHMFYMGKHGEPLVDERFQAWDYGPVLPKLYEKIKFYGREPVKDVFYNSEIKKDCKEGNIIRDAATALKDAKPGVLVSYTHKHNGAWEKNYLPGERFVVIPNEDIISEYRMIEEASDERT